MAKIRKKKFLYINVYDAAIERVRYLYDTFDKVVVSFSGGKDSTAVLNMCKIVAREKNRLPVEVMFFDEEVIEPPTIEYVARLREDKELDVKWYCLEFEQRNGCSNEYPFWHSWDKECEKVWVRQMPEWAIKEHPLFERGMPFQDFSNNLYAYQGKIAVCTGLRAEESLSRYRVAASKKHDNYISASRKGVHLCHPIYDWLAQDVWILISKLKCDYNRAYDLFNLTDNHNKFLLQRVCTPFGQEPLRGIENYAQCFPEHWARMCKRVPGVTAGHLYGNTKLYGVGGVSKPVGSTWHQYIDVLINSFQGEKREIVQHSISRMIDYHYDMTDDTIGEDPHPLTGCSYPFLAKVAIKGDFKGRTANGMSSEGAKILRKMNINYEEAKRIYGKKKK